jgi:putative monooxygenase
MMRRGGIGALLVAACGHAAPTPAGPGSGSASGSAAASGSVRDQLEHGSGDSGDDSGAKVDPDEIRIAAIEKAMNQLAPVANQCWAAAATDDFHLAGKLKMLISFDAGGRADAKATEDTAHDPVLTDCLVRVIAGYPWPAGVMAGQAIELPFAFTAPHGQNTIDRRLVAKSGGKGAQLQVLLDDKNSGNPAASMIEVDLDPGATLPLARTARDQVWIFLDPARLGGPGGKLADVAALDAAYLAKDSYRTIAAPDGAAARVLIIAVPGGDEFQTRAGALPDPVLVPRPHPMPSGGKVPDPRLLSPPPRGSRGPELHARAKARRFPRTGGATTILIEDAPHVASADIIEMDAGAHVPTHVHDTETELLYLLAGAGTMTVDGVDMPVGPTTVVQIPAGTPHSFAATEAVTAIQLYAPPGPEQRFKKMK